MKFLFYLPFDDTPGSLQRLVHFLCVLAAGLGHLRLAASTAVDERGDLLDDGAGREARVDRRIVAAGREMVENTGF